ncbi:MAG: hypothetical protein H7836_04485 [Magnetococcus sp. YQC-3]
MAVDKVKHLKIENPSSGGTETDPFPTESNPTQDYSAIKGIAFENNDNRLLDLDASGNMQFKDFTEAAYIQLWKLRRSIYNIFDNSTNGFTATNEQAAIEEARNTAVGKARFAMAFVANGVLGNNTWLGFSELVPSNTTPLIIPVACTLKELAFSFAGANVDGQMKIFKNGLVNPTNVVYTMTLTNANTYKLDTGVNVNLVAGDRLSAQWIDTGDNPNDGCLQWFFQTS